jgi:hypothetical protein
MHQNWNKLHNGMKNQDLVGFEIKYLYLEKPIQKMMIMTSKLYVLLLRNLMK